MTVCNCTAVVKNGYQLNTGQTFQVLKTWKVYFGILSRFKWEALKIMN